MPLYANAFPTNYDEIRTYYPVWYYDVLDMDAIWRATGGQLDGVQGGIEALIDNNFVATADERTIRALEEFLYIPADPSKSLRERRQLVGSFFTPSPHIGAPEIREMVSSFTAGDVSVELVGGTIHVKVARDIAELFNLGDCRYVLESRIPAHLGLVLMDMPRPITFVNKPGDMVLVSFLVQASVTNVLNDSSINRLNGRRLLDGSWLLGSFTDKGLFLHSLTVTAKAINKEEACVGLALRHQFRYTGRSELSGVTMALNAKNEQRADIPAVAVTAEVASTEDLTAALTTDSMWRMDGNMTLDGSRKLNADIVRSDL